MGRFRRVICSIHWLYVVVFGWRKYFPVIRPFGYIAGIDGFLFVLRLDLVCVVPLYLQGVCLSVRLAGCLSVWPSIYLYLAGWLIGWLAGYLVGCLAG